MSNINEQDAVQASDNPVYMPDAHAFSLAVIGVLSLAALGFYAVSWALGGTH